MLFLIHALTFTFMFWIYGVRIAWFWGLFWNTNISPKRLDRVCCFWPWEWNWNLFVQKYQSTLEKESITAQWRKESIVAQWRKEYILKAGFSWIGKSTIYFKFSENAKTIMSALLVDITLPFPLILSRHCLNLNILKHINIVYSL